MTANPENTPSPLAATIGSLFADIEGAKFGLATTGKSGGGDNAAIAVALIDSTQDATALRDRLRTAFTTKPALREANLFIVIHGILEGGPSASSVFGYGQAIAIGVPAGLGSSIGSETVFHNNGKGRLAIDDLDTVLNAMLLAERPVLSARMHCIVPMQFGELSRTPVENLAAYRRFRRGLLQAAGTVTGISFETGDEGRHYFLPHVHQLLVTDAAKSDAWTSDEILDERVISLRIEPDSDALLVVKRKTRQNRELIARVEAVRVHLYTERTLALEYTLAIDPLVSDKGLKAGAALWSDIVLAGGDADGRSAAAWLDYAEAARILFSTFKADKSSDRDRRFSMQLVTAAEPRAILAEMSGWGEESTQHNHERMPVIDILNHFLKPVFPIPTGYLTQAGSKEDRSPWFELRGDHRARVVQSLVISGTLPIEGGALARLPAFEGLFAGVDEYGADRRQDAQFAATHTDRGTYDRYRRAAGGAGNRFFATDHNFAHMGFGGFALDVIAADHIQNHYRRMALLIHLNGAVINGLLRDVADALKGWNPARAADEHRIDQLIGLHRRFLKFLNLNWFERVSSRSQGIELYDLILKWSQAARELPLLDQEISRTSAYLAEEREWTRGARDKFLTAVLTFAGLVAAFQLTISHEFSAAKLWSGELAGAIAMIILAFLTRIGLLESPLPDCHGWRANIGTISFLVFAFALAFAPLWPDWSFNPSPSWACWAYVVVSVTVTGWLFWRLTEPTLAKGPADATMINATRALYGVLACAFVLLVSLHATGLITPI